VQAVDQGLELVRRGSDVGHVAPKLSKLRSHFGNRAIFDDLIAWS
jgi:hypothetical protein